jgi:hypothetical protein
VLYGLEKREPGSAREFDVDEGSHTGFAPCFAEGRRSPVRHAVHAPVRVRALSVILVFYLVSLGFTEAQVGLLLTLTLAGDIAISLLLTT